MWSFSKGGTEILYKTALFSEVSYNISKLGNRLQLCRILKIFGKDNDKNIKMKKSPSIKNICYMYLLFPKKIGKNNAKKLLFPMQIITYLRLIFPSEMNDLYRPKLD